MSGNYKYIWRCAKCSNHLANVINMSGMLRIEKKCAKCKSLNILTLANKEILIRCEFYAPSDNGYNNGSDMADYQYSESIN